MNPILTDADQAMLHGEGSGAQALAMRVLVGMARATGWMAG